MFTADFYPTPAEVIEQMNVDCYGKLVLEPSAGKGNIVDYLKENGAKSVIACEKNDDLRKILSGKCDVVGGDFFNLSAEQISHIQLIVMNPPFSCADKHILHAWGIAPDGCEIISLCNYETIDNASYNRRRELTKLIHDYGEAEDLGNCFKWAERKTNVQVGLVKLFKPAVSKDFDFDGFYLETEQEEQANGIMSYNEIRAIVNSYVAAVKCFDKVREVANELNRYTDVTEFGGGISFQAGYDNQITTKEEFAKQMQKHCWKHVFKLMNIDKYVTKGVMQDINKFVENRQNYPFTMRNVYRMFEIIIGTRVNIMNRAIVEAIDNFTKHTHENRYNVEGWKTNSGYMLNRKFISGWICEPNYGRGLGIKDYGGNFEKLRDLTKAMCYLTGTNYDALAPIKSTSLPKETQEMITSSGRLPYPTPDGYNSFIPNTWYSWGFFDFKLFKKGTGHFKFKDENVWATLNRAYAKAKGQVLPEKI